jgi:hypothetical protein
MALEKSVIGSGLNDAKIKVAAGDVYDIKGVVTAEGSPELSETEIKGDDTILGTFVSAQKETLTIKASAISFDVLQAITGNSYSSSASGGKIALGTAAEQNPPFVEIQAFTTAKNTDATGTNVTLKKTWHKVQIKSIKMSQANEQEFNVEMEGVAVQTATEIDGTTALSPARIATVEFYA